MQEAVSRDTGSSQEHAQESLPANDSWKFTSKNHTVTVIKCLANFSGDLDTNCHLSNDLRNFARDAKVPNDE